MTEIIAPYGKQFPDRVGNNWDRVRSLVEFITGIVVSSKDDFKLSVGHALQGALKQQFLETLMDEIDSYREKGRIKDEDFQTKQGQACFMEMLNFLDEDNPDGIRFEFMKKLYLGIMSDEEQDRTYFFLSNT